MAGRGWLRRCVLRTTRAALRGLSAPFLKRVSRRDAPQLNERPLEYGFALNCLAKLTTPQVLDAGSGMTAWPHLLHSCGYQVTALDRMSSYWEEGFFNRHFYVINDDLTRLRLTGQFDAITCLSTLEHIAGHNAAMRGLFSLLRPGGYLVLTVPYNESHYVDNAYALPDAAYGRDYRFICQVFSRRELDGWLAANGGEIVEQQLYQVFTGAFWACGERIVPARPVSAQEKHHLLCVLLRKA